MKNTNVWSTRSDDVYERTRLRPRHTRSATQCQYSPASASYLFEASVAALCSAFSLSAWLSRVKPSLVLLISDVHHPAPVTFPIQMTIPLKCSVLSNLHPSPSATTSNLCSPSNIPPTGPCPSHDSPTGASGECELEGGLTDCMVGLMVMGDWLGRLSVAVTREPGVREAVGGVRVTGERRGFQSDQDEKSLRME